MEKLERDFEDNDYLELDDVLDQSFFATDDLEDVDEDESNYEVRSSDFRPISEL